uniref:PDZ domain-containing protein n=1 Tax=Esox lucius TaxID=8010 RepID=A0AAY5KAH1_ESOLU
MENKRSGSSQESGVIVKMPKETCAEGLVVSGGGKEGIFIKEVRPESPAAKLLSFHEGDQILSATVYFDDVTYEDALQILEHAHSYKMELLLKRKPIKTSTLDSEPAVEINQKDSLVTESLGPSSPISAKVESRILRGLTVLQRQKIRGNWNSAQQQVTQSHHLNFRIL